MGKIRNISDKTYWMFQDMRGNKTNDEYLKELLCNADPTSMMVPPDPKDKKKAELEQALEALKDEK